MPTVKFTEVEEFLEELGKDAPQIDRRIVRTTFLFESSAISPKISHVLVIATYTIAGQIVRFERYCGDLWGLNETADQAIKDTGEKCQKEIEEACQRLGLERRAGVIE